jgi:D-amino peptidase
VIFIGYHASTTNPAGVRAHTMSSANFADVRLNGVSMPEAGLNAAVAGHFNVPVVMISGDDVIVKEAQALLGPIAGAVVKWALGFHAARTMTPEAGRELIRETAKNAIGRIRDFKPFRVQVPVTLDLRFKNYRPSEVLAMLPIVERTDAHSIRYRAKDMLEATRFLEFVLQYEPGLSP